jgi:hypothetical protein
MAAAAHRTVGRQHRECSGDALWDALEDRVAEPLLDLVREAVAEVTTG